jgi:hypothetical protein
MVRRLKMKTKGIILIMLGFLGSIFICIFDIIMGKPVNDITGPKSISALVLCGVLIIIGILLLFKKAKV